MKIKNFIYGFLITFSVAFVVTAAVTFLYSQLVHSEGIIDWETSIRQGLIFGIIFPLLFYKKERYLIIKNNLLRCFKGSS